MDFVPEPNQIFFPQIVGRDCSFWKGARYCTRTALLSIVMCMSKDMDNLIAQWDLKQAQHSVKLFTNGPQTSIQNFVCYDSWNKRPSR